MMFNNFNVSSLLMMQYCNVRYRKLITATTLFKNLVFPSTILNLICFTVSVQYDR